VSIRREETVHVRFSLVGAAAILIGAMVASAHAQWVNYPAPGIRRTKDGKPNLSAAAPRAADGRPDLSGVWITDSTPLAEMERLFPNLGAFAVPGDDPRQFTKYFFNVFVDLRPEDVPMRPETARLLKQRLDEGPSKEVPTSSCLPAGIPMGDLLPVPRRIVQVPGLLVILSEGINPQRLVYTDGRAHPADAQPAWLGYSVGRWDGNTMVIDTRGFNDRTWLDAMGHPHTEALHTIERMRRRDFGHMDVDVTIDDPGAYTKPVSFRYTQTLTPDTDLLETVCENEKDRAHLDTIGTP
jgi:hypothetical protein